MIKLIMLKKQKNVFDSISTEEERMVSVDNWLSHEKSLAELVLIKLDFIQPGPLHVFPPLKKTSANCNKWVQFKGAWVERKCFFCLFLKTKALKSDLRKQ